MRSHSSNGSSNNDYAAEAHGALGLARRVVVNHLRDGLFASDAESEWLCKATHDAMGLRTIHAGFQVAASFKSSHHIFQGHSFWPKCLGSGQRYFGGE